MGENGEGIMKPGNVKRSGVRSIHETKGGGNSPVWLRVKEAAPGVLKGFLQGRGRRRTTRTVRRKR